METRAFVDCFLLLFILLNPFLLCVYLIDLIQNLDRAAFSKNLVRAAVIAFFVFGAFAWFGDAIFARVLQVRFAAFLIFGGAIFFGVGIRFVFVGSEAIQSLRGKPENLAGSIAMPILIGPGTISASIFAGSRLPVHWAFASIALALTAAVVGVLLLKWLHDVVREENNELVDRSIDVVGRVSALVIGTIAVEMILRGIELWLGISKFGV